MCDSQILAQVIGRKAGKRKKASLLGEAFGFRHQRFLVPIKYLSGASSTFLIYEYEVPRSG